MAWTPCRDLRVAGFARDQPRPGREADSGREGATVSRQQQTFVVVGAGLAGAKAAETLCHQGFAGRS